VICKAAGTVRLSSYSNLQQDITQKTVEPNYFELTEISVHIISNAYFRYLNIAFCYDFVRLFHLVADQTSL
jgi:hypothetical protein